MLSGTPCGIFGRRNWFQAQGARRGAKRGLRARRLTLRVAAPLSAPPEPCGRPGFEKGGAVRVRDSGRGMSSSYEGRDEVCPVSTRGGTRLVQLVREGRGGEALAWMAPVRPGKRRRSSSVKPPRRGSAAPAPPPDTGPAWEVLSLSVAFVPCSALLGAGTASSAPAGAPPPLRRSPRTSPEGG